MIELIFLFFLVIFGIATSSKSYKKKTANYVFVCPSCKKTISSNVDHHVCHKCQVAMVSTKVLTNDWQRLKKWEKTKIIEDCSNASYFVHQEEYQSADLNNSNSPSAEIITSLTIADQIQKYKELLDSGAISQDEFDAKKKQILGL